MPCNPPLTSLLLLTSEFVVLRAYFRNATLRSDWKLRHRVNVKKRGDSLHHLSQIKSTQNPPACTSSGCCLARSRSFGWELLYTLVWSRGKGHGYSAEDELHWRRVPGVVRQSAGQPRRSCRSRSRAADAIQISCSSVVCCSAEENIRLGYMLFKDCDIKMELKRLIIMTCFNWLFSPWNSIILIILSFINMSQWDKLVNLLSILAW